MRKDQQPCAFISYSHKNKKELEELHKYLRYIEQKKRLCIWGDKSIQTGDDWLQAIEEALARATVAVLLITADYFASDFITGKELPVLLRATREGKLTLLSVIVGPCLFHETPLAQFQALNEKPLALMSKAKRDETWVQIAKMITAALLEAEKAK
jgi:hypothetical protein